MVSGFVFNPLEKMRRRPARDVLGFLTNFQFVHWVSGANWEL